VDHLNEEDEASDEERVYRTAVFARENGIGIRLSGGNRVGIFICDVQYGSPSEKAGLRVADKIVSVNGVSYATLTREQAVQHILGIHTLIEMVVVYSKRGECLVWNSDEDTFDSDC
jgi:C-terminal processing protease CtpA/Prc